MSLAVLRANATRQERGGRLAPLPSQRFAL